jgi:two-component system, chemotaxis family, protein-glutamate methylesterase/glutaminase
MNGIKLAAKHLLSNTPGKPYLIDVLFNKYHRLMNNEPKYVVVIGASAGGFNAVSEVISHINKQTDAAYFVVLHLSTKSISGYLAHRLQEFTELKCLLAMDGLPIRKGHVYVAVPNQHLLVEKGEVHLSNGPTENRWRPSIDVLFRSAAANYGNRVIGVVLTGLLNDGTSGMSGIKRVGGFTIVQDPNEAEYPDMPMSVLNSMDVDHCVSLSQIGGVIDEITGNKPAAQEHIPDDITAEDEVMDNMITRIDKAEEMGRLSHYTCPDCGGVLFLHEQDAITKFKCHIGHSYTIRDLLIKQVEEVEKSMWVAIRSLEQRKAMLESLAEKYHKTGNNRTAKEYEERSGELDSHIETLKNVIAASAENPED